MYSSSHCHLTMLEMCSKLDVDFVISVYIGLNAWNPGFHEFSPFFSLALRIFRLNLSSFLGQQQGLPQKKSRVVSPPQVLQQNKFVIKRSVASTHSSKDPSVLET